MSRSSLLSRAHGSLSNHVRRLGQTLDDVRLRLREAVAGAIGHAVAGVVRETIHALLQPCPEALTSPSPTGWSPRTSLPLWDEPDDHQREEDSEQLLPDVDDEELED